MTITVGRALLVSALFAAAVPLTNAWANGAGFFEEMEDENQDSGSPFFGFAKESNGRYLAGTTITATIKSMNSSVTAHTDVQGHYRIPGFAKDINPKDVEISCAKDGYKQVSVRRRPPAGGGTNPPIEVDCTLAKN